MPSYLFPSFEWAYKDGRIDPERDNLYLMLTAGYKPDAQHGLTDVEGECKGRGYTQGGKALTGVHWEEGDDMRTLLADDVHWPDAMLRPTGAVLYAEEGLIGYYDFGPAVEAGPVLVEWPEGRVLELR